MKFSKNIIAGIVGNILEWYDFVTYAYLSPTLSKLFFPPNDQHALLKTLLIFAIGYLARPIGGIIFGYIGDVLGRKKAMQLSIGLMGIFSMLIAFLPTYTCWGYSATLLLLILRLFQGIVMGGELINSTAFIYEISPIDHRSYYCSWVRFGTIAGILLGSLIIGSLHNVFTPQQMQFVWRLPFLLGIVLVLFGIWLRKNIDTLNKPITKKTFAKNHSFNYLDLFKTSYRAILQIAGINLFAAIAFYILFVFMPIYLSTILKKYHHSDTLLLNSVALIVLIILIPLIGKLSDTIGKRKSALFSLLSIAICALPLFYILNHINSLIITLLLVATAIMMSGIEGVISATMAQLFIDSYRASGIGIAYNTTAALFGGTAPAICAYFINHLSPLFPAYYLILVSILAIPAFIFIPKK